MICKQDIQDNIFKYIAEQMKCSVSELHSGETIFILDKAAAKTYVKILSVGDTNVVTASADRYSDAVKCLRGKNRDELFESDFVFGQTLYYIPDINMMNPVPYVEEFTFKLLEGDEIKSLQGIQEFDNSLSFDEDGNTPTCIVLYAQKGDEIVAIAGASVVNNKLREVGIDVKKDYRRKNLASLLVHNLTIAIMERDKIPFYSASVTNLASQAVAIRSGYMPLWTDTFGTRDIQLSDKK